MHFHFGSITATFCQGLILGTYVQGISVHDDSFAGTPFDWLTPFSLVVGLAMVCGYVLLGATWLIMKTDGEVYEWAKKVTIYIILYIIFFMGVVSLWVPYLNSQMMERWFSWPNIIYLSPIPLITSICIMGLIKAVNKTKTTHKIDHHPFLYSISLFILGYIGLGASLWPWVVPFSITLREASSVGTTQKYYVNWSWDIFTINFKLHCIFVLYFPRKSHEVRLLLNIIIRFINHSLIF